MNDSRFVQPPTLVMWLVAAVAAGIAMAHWLMLEHGVRLPLWWMAVGWGICLGVGLWRRMQPVLLVAGVLTGAVFCTLRWQHFVEAELPADGAVIEGVVSSAPQQRGRMTKARVSVSGGVEVMLSMPSDSTLREGQHIAFCGKGEKLRPVWAAPYFHYDTWLLHQGVTHRAFAFRHVVADTAAGESLRGRVVSLLRSAPLEQQDEGVLEAMVLGSRQNLSPELRAQYSDAGGGHLLALSGLHLGIIVGVFLWLLRRRWLRLMLLLPLVWGYVWLTGAPLSLVRAASMLSLWLLAGALSRHSNGRDTLALSVLILLGINPFWLFDAGFQLSVVAVLGLTFLRRGRRVLGLVKVGLYASVATAPLVAFYFHRLPLLGWLMSVVYVPLTAVALCGTLLLMLLLVVGLPVDWLVWVVHNVLGVQHWLMEHTAWGIDGLSPSWLTVMVAYVGLLAFVHRRRMLLAFAAVTLLLSMWYDRMPLPSPQVIFEGRRAVVVHSRRDIDMMWAADTTSQVADASSQTAGASSQVAYPSPQVADLYIRGGVTILRVNRPEWRHLHRATPMPVDYLWVCRGFNGHMDDLLRCVVPGQVVLDESLSPFYRYRFASECDSLGLRRSFFL